MFDVPFDGRWRVYEEKVAAFAQALTGEPFEYRGATVQVTPPPYQRPRPPVLLGGAMPAAPLRAARLADGYMPPIPDPALYEAYLAERARLGKPPGELVKPSGPLFVHISEDPDRAWAAIAPHALHEANEYAKWAALVPGSNPWTPMEDADLLRAQGLYAVVTPDECVALAASLEEGSKLILHPLMGGLPPDRRGGEPRAVRGRGAAPARRRRRLTWGCSTATTSSRATTRSAGGSPVEPARYDFATRVAAAAGAGFRGIGTALRRATTPRSGRV